MIDIQEVELEALRELERKLSYGIWSLAYENNSQENYETATEYLYELIVMAEQLIKDKYNKGI